MPPYMRVGDPPKKRHSVFEGPSGRLAEELMGQSGFSGASSLLYHAHSPSALVAADTGRGRRDRTPEPNAALLPYHFRLGSLGAGHDLVTGRHALLGNADVTVCWVSSEQFERALPQRDRRRACLRVRGQRQARVCIRQV